MKIAFLGNFGVDYSSESHHKKTLEAMGHTVMSLQEARTTAETILTVAQDADMFIWVHTHGWETPTNTNLGMVEVLERLREKGVPTVTYHLDIWFGIQRQKDLTEDSFYSHIQHFFTVDKKMADWFNENTKVKGHYIHAGVYDKECYIDTSLAGGENRHPVYKHDVIFVGSKNYHPEWSYRPELIDWLQATYGSSFTRYAGDTPTGTTRGQALNKAFADTKVVVGDSLVLNFDYPYYWSDRAYETLGRGGFLIHPYVKGMEEDFVDGEHLVFYKFGDFKELKDKIDYYIAHDEEREKIRHTGHEHVKANHTYLHRWETIIKELTSEHEY